MKIEKKLKILKIFQFFSLFEVSFASGGHVYWLQKLERRSFESAGIKDSIDGHNNKIGVIVLER